MFFLIMIGGQMIYDWGIEEENQEELAEHPGEHLTLLEKQM